VSLHLGLGSLDLPRDHAGLDRLVVRDAQHVHHSLDALPAEDAHEVVFQREEKLKGAGVSLACGAADKLAVDAGLEVGPRGGIRVNEFLSVDGVNVYQQDYGWAPTMVVTNPAGKKVFDGPIQFFDDPGNIGDKALGDGVLKVPDFGYTIKGFKQALQIGAKMSIFGSPASASSA